VGFWDMFKNAIFYVINFFFSFTHDWGMAIILITLLFRILIFPITAKQFKSTYKMQKLQPKIKEIQAKYADDKTRQQEELMKVYREAKFNPLSGCLPMILQIPIFMALYQVLQSLPDLIANAGHPEYVLPATFYGIIPDLSQKASDVFELSASGLLASLPYLLMLLLFGLSIIVPMLLQQQRDRNTMIMSIVMSGMMLFFGWTVPAGVLLYWDTSAVIGVAQQLISKKYYERKDREAQAETIIIEPVKVEVERKEKKDRPHKNR